MVCVVVVRSVCLSEGLGGGDGGGGGEMTERDGHYSGTNATAQPLTVAQSKGVRWLMSVWCVRCGDSRDLGDE